MSQLLQQIKLGDTKALARCISLIENESPGYEELLLNLPVTATPAIIGITGPPGAGKSTIADGLIGEFIKEDKKVGVLCVDPSSPFNYGSLLGDRIRMREWYNHPNVFIRSLATRGSLGGLHPKIIEITDTMKVAGFDYILIETVGVGQSEVEIAGQADVTIVVLVPESGDEIQTMKAGIMEVADIFVVNKSDRPDAKTFINNLKLMLSPAFNNNDIEIIKTIASEKYGIKELKQAILNCKEKITGEKKYTMLAEKAWLLIQNKRMKNVNKLHLKNDIEMETKAVGSFNLYKYIHKYLNE